jgi:hypothetical protein
LFSAISSSNPKTIPGTSGNRNNLVMRDIMISANKDGQMFSKSMEVLKIEAHGMSTVVGPKVLALDSCKWLLDLSF